ncbi:UNVERIFIED_CONTAM: hypothetical protein GTU68_016143, partial [Idotea baltica]|nr:hypothetical protein [Idotea baltica]
MQVRVFELIFFFSQGRDKKGNAGAGDGGKAWSGDASKKQGFQVDSSIDVNINAENGGEEAVQTKEKPIWLTEATSFITTNITSSDPSRVRIVLFVRRQLLLDSLPMNQILFLPRLV